MGLIKRDKSEMPQSSQNRQTSGGGPVFMLIGGALTVIAAGLSLYNGSKTREDNEKQREHERDMAQRSETNPNIKVQTGKITHEHHLIGDFAGLDSDTVSRLSKTGIKAIES